MGVAREAARAARSKNGIQKGVTMLKGCLTIAAVIAMLTAGVHAGEIKTHEWPCTFVALEITTIPVVMDIGYFIRVKSQNNLQIKLVQDTQDLHLFTGCTNMTVESNFNAALECSITKTGAVDGSYTCSLDPQMIDAGSTSVKVCATLKNANLATNGGPLAGAKNVQVATVKIRVKPV
jgi:hypothetical protein